MLLKFFIFRENFPEPNNIYTKTTDDHSIWQKRKTAKAYKWNNNITENFNKKKASVCLTILLLYNFKRFVIWYRVFRCFLAFRLKQNQFQFSRFISYRFCSIALSIVLFLTFILTPKREFFSHSKLTKSSRQHIYISKKKRKENSLQIISYYNRIRRSVAAISVGCKKREGYCHCWILLRIKFKWNFTIFFCSLSFPFFVPLRHHMQSKWHTT